MFYDLQDKDEVIAQLNRDFQALNSECSEKNLKLQALEKQLLKSKEDLDMLTSKFEAFKDIEVVRLILKISSIFR